MNRRPFVGILASFAIVSVGCGAVSGGESDLQVDQITVAAASSLRPAFEELGEMFTMQTGTKVTFSFGSSGGLREQIINGAPFDLYASANGEFVDQVIQAGRGVAATRVDYAQGRIVLWAREGAELPTSIDDLADPRFRRIAVAQPQNAPYGFAAVQALTAAGVISAVQDRLVYGENISDTFRIIESGNADVGIIALSMAVADGSDYRMIPEDLYDPVAQALVVTSTGARGKVATAFAEFIGSPAGKEVMIRNGFTPLGESPQRDQDR
jgi:molybdate transport system substrate-binding protein